MFAPDDNGVYILSEDEVSYYPDADPSQRIEVTQRNDITHIDADILGLYVSVTQPGGEAVLLIDNSGQTIKEWPLPTDKHVLQLEATDSAIVLLVSEKTITDYEVPEGVIWLLDRASGELVKPVFENDDENDMWHACMFFTPIDDERLYISGYTDALVTLNPPMLESIGMWGMNPTAATSRGNPDEIFFLLGDNNEIGRYDVAKRQLSNLISISELTGLEGSSIPTLTGLRFGSNRLYTADLVDNTLWWVRIDTSSIQRRTLTVVSPRYFNNGPIEMRANMMFQTLHPDVDLAVSTPDRDNLATSLMAGEPGLDMLMLVSDMPMVLEVDTLYQAGVLLDLRSHLPIAKNMEHWIDTSMLFGYEGGIHAIPIYSKVYINPWFVDESLSEMLDINIPQKGWTLSDLYKLSDVVENYNESAPQPLRLLASYSNDPILIRQYIKNSIDPIHGKIAIDTPEFRELLVWWKAASEKGLIYDRRRLFQLGSNEVAGDALFSSSFLELHSLSEGMYIYPPQTHEAGKYLALRIGIAVNARANQMDLALDYLTCLSSVEAQTADELLTGLPMLRDTSLYPKRDNPTLEMQSSYQLDAKQPSDQYLKMFIDLCENSYAEAYTELDYWFLNRFADYLNGELSVDQLAADYQERADMMIHE